VKPLYELGADEVVPEEFETSIEIFTRVLEKYLIPTDNIEALIAEVRSDGYKMFRSFPTETSSTSDLKIQLPNIKISTLSVPENSALVGESLATSQLRRKFGILVLAIRRNSQIISNPDRNTQICAEDELIVLGAPDKISELERLIINPK
jgi:CPA2 family monovalent cation:H+ antiporter-2